MNTTDMDSGQVSDETTEQTARTHKETSAHKRSVDKPDCAYALCVGMYNLLAHDRILCGKISHAIRRRHSEPCIRQCFGVAERSG